MEDVSEVGLDRLWAEEERVGDLDVRASINDEVSDLKLAFGAPPGDVARGPGANSSIASTNTQDGRSRSSSAAEPANTNMPRRSAIVALAAVSVVFSMHMAPAAIGLLALTAAVTLRERQRATSRT